VFHVHAHATAVFEDQALETVTRRTDDHFEAALLSCPPDVGGFTAQGGFGEVALIHGWYYILARFFAPCYNIHCTDELTTARIEKWATPTFLFVITKKYTEQ
jgi:hypothetical protein